jgi:hypothetical protein
MLTEHISRLTGIYAGHRNLKLSTVSTYAASDGKWLRNLRRPEVSCTLRKAHGVVEWFSAHWPADLEWPRDIPRPPKARKDAA